MKKKEIIERLNNGEVIHVNNEKEREAIMNAFGMLSEKQHKIKNTVLDVVVIICGLSAVVSIFDITNMETLFLALQEMLNVVLENPINILLIGGALSYVFLGE